MIIKSRIATFQPFCLTNRQRSISEHRSFAAAQYFTAFTERAGTSQKLPVWIFRGQKNPNEILRNSVSLTVPVPIFKLSIHRTTTYSRKKVSVFTSKNQPTVTWLEKSAWITFWRLPPPVWYLLPPSCVIVHKKKKAHRLLVESLTCKRFPRDNKDYPKWRRGLQPLGWSPLNLTEGGSQAAVPVLWLKAGGWQRWLVKH